MTGFRQAAAGRGIIPAIGFGAALGTALGIAGDRPAGEGDETR